MSDQNVKSLENSTPETPVTPTATTPVQTGGRTYTEQDVERMIKERLEREKVVSERKAKEAADRAAAEADAKNGEWEKLAKQREVELEELRSQFKASELAALKRSIAEKVGLSMNLAARLIGETAEEIEKDARALLETLPKPKQNAGFVPNPGAGGSLGETAAQKRERLGMQ
jgi:hypothetical protein